MIGLPSGVVVQSSDRINPSLDYLPCSVETVGLVKDRRLNTTAAVMTRDDDVADF